jgi:hypothetical protein
MHADGTPAGTRGDRTVRVDEPSPGVRVITLNRPHRLNTISGELISDLHRASITVSKCLRTASRISQAASLGTWPSQGPSGRMDGCLPPASLRIGGVATRTRRSAGSCSGGGGSGRLGCSSPGRGCPRAGQADRRVRGGTPGVAHA